MNNNMLRIIEVANNFSALCFKMPIYGWALANNAIRFGLFD